MSQPQQVAIVDDDPGVRGSIVSLLRSAGLAGIPFAGADELLSCTQADAIDCIVTDLHMPGMTGIDLQAALRRDHWHQPLIVMTAFPTPAARDQVMANGACAFLTKPVDPDALLDAIGQALEAHQG